ncbi:MAG: hypothetical protein Q9227_008491 [Pyrenula ochraceoflavens]
MARVTDPPALSSTKELSPSTEEPVKDATTSSAPNSLPSSTPTTSESAQKARDLTSATLNFLSNASNETLGACAVGLCATTYLVLGRVGLVLIGAVGGVVLHATWEGSPGDSDSDSHADRKRRREVGVEVAKRVLDWRGKDQLSEPVFEQNGTENASSVNQKTDFAHFKPATRAALTSLTDAVVRDYVNPVLPGETAFPHSCRNILTSFILSISNHLGKKRPNDTFLDFLTNTSSIVIVFLNELSTALMNNQAAGTSAGDAVRTYLRDEPGSSLSNVLNPKEQAIKLGLVADDILQNFLDRDAYRCEPVKVFLREILSGLVLEMTIDRCSKPEWINGWIVYLLEAGEPEILNAIDAGVESMEKAASAENGELETSNTLKAPKDDGGHHRRVSKAEQAMQEAMLEAKRLSEMIAADEAQKEKVPQQASDNGDTGSSATTEAGIPTPTSSNDDHLKVDEKAPDSSQLLPDIPDENIPATPPEKTPQVFTDFGQLSLPEKSASFLPGNLSPQPMDPAVAPVLTLYKASVTLIDDTLQNDKTILKAKPIVEYLLQIEPASSRFPGWMIARKYADFETLHEVLRRISVVSGVSAFAEKHSTLPTWKGQSKAFLRQNLERYLQHALQFEALAESEGMKRFLEKETGLQKAPAASKNPFAFKGPAALETVGKGMLDVLGSAPKGIAGGGKAVLGGVQGVFGAVGVGAPRKAVPSPARASRNSSVTSLSRSDNQNRPQNQDSSVHSSPLESRPPLPQRPTRTASSESFRARTTLHSTKDESQESLHLPPPPSAIPEDYDVKLLEKKEPTMNDKLQGDSPTKHTSLGSTPLKPTNPSAIPEKITSVPQLGTEEQPQKTETPDEKPVNEESKVATLSEAETMVAVELFFAIINELYTLSSAWNIRLAMLNAAKTFLLRPGNPNLETIRLLIQDDIITANFTSDTGLAHHLTKLRENALPTEEDLKAWPPEPSTEEKENLRKKARKLLVEKGMPQALTSVMGTYASGEALGRVFDCLQVQEVSRGLVFAILLQGIRAATQ